MLNSNHLYELFKKGEYTLSCAEQNLPDEFFELAVTQLAKRFPRSIATRKSFNVDGILISGYQIHDKDGVIESIVIINTSTKLKEKSFFKCALYCLFNQLHGFDLAHIFGAYINNKFTVDNNEDFFNIDQVNEETLLLLPYAKQAMLDIADTEPKAQSQTPTLAEDILPKPFKKELKTFIANKNSCLLSDLPTYLLSDRQRIIRQAHLTNTPFLDIDNLYTDLTTLCDLNSDIYMLDFEAAQFVVPTWKDITPYSQVAFQYSLHKYSNSVLYQAEYLELISDPREALAKQLIKDVGTSGAILTFNARFERDVIRTLAKTFPELKGELLAITDRLVDLHPLFKNYYYHPLQNGSWSLKALLPAILGENPYQELDGTSNGTDAASIYHKVRAGEVNQKKAEKELSNYCTLDTYALYQMLMFIVNAHAAQTH